jgi:hypothetical protein
MIYPLTISTLPLIVWYRYTGPQPRLGDAVGLAVVVGYRSGFVLLRF